MARTSALRSGELSRQVGATLVSMDGDLIAVGANDVPRRGGGLHWQDRIDDRDHLLGSDSNTHERHALLLRVAKELNESDPDEFAKKLNKTSLRSLTEYGRAVHAEMDALIACARSGHSARGGTRFVTTFPCHNCARHIIAAGVERVVYVEPYPKSRALHLHRSDISDGDLPAGGEPRPVHFVQHRGVAGRRFFDYFSMELETGLPLKRKDAEGSLIPWEGMDRRPRFPLQMQSVEDTERAIAQTIGKLAKP